MNADQMATETDELNRMVKARWPKGWASLLRQGGEWTALAYNNCYESQQFTATTPRAALDQLRDYLNRDQPMTTERLASILGIELAA
jgi:hypothetical protein